MNRKKIFTLLTLALALVCLAAFAWVGNPWDTDPVKITVTTEAELRAAVANENAGDIIVINGKINMGATSLSIPEGRTVTLSLDVGSILDFSNVAAEEVAMYYTSTTLCIGIYNLGNLTISGSGDMVMSGDKYDRYKLISCSGDASLSVTGGNLAVNGGNDACVICNYGANSDITVTGGNLTANGREYVCVICNYGANSDVTVTGGSLTADGSGEQFDACTILNGMDCDYTIITVTGGNLTASGNGIYATVIENCSAESDIVVTGGNLTANGNVDRACVICNAPLAHISSITVTGGNLTVSGEGDNCAIYGYGGADAVITVAGGNLTVSGKGDNCAIYNSEDSDYNINIMVLSGDFKGSLYKYGDRNQIAVHGGTFREYSDTDWDRFIAHECTSTDHTEYITVNNCAEVKFNADNSNTVRIGEGESKTINVKIISKDLSGVSPPEDITPQSVKILNYTDITKRSFVVNISSDRSTFIRSVFTRSVRPTLNSVEGLPINISENKITVENNGCPIGTSYDLIVLAEGANRRKAVKILKILVGEASETESNI